MTVRSELLSRPPPPAPIPARPRDPGSEPLLEVIETEAHEPHDEPERPVGSADPQPSSGGSASSGRNPALVAALKEIYAVSKDAGLDEGYGRYAELLASGVFEAASLEDQRQVLKMMIHAKPPPEVSDRMRHAHEIAIRALRSLVDAQGDAADCEMLGMAYVVTGHPEDATATFKKGLEIERARDPGSDLCGNLMRRVSQL